MEPTAAERLVRRFEGCKLVAYRKEDGVWTIGWGHTAGVKERDTCTQEQADEWLRDDLDEARLQLITYSPGPFVVGAEDALTDFVYNLGIGRYRSSTLRDYVDLEKWNLVKEELLKWDHEAGKVVEGLLDRRKAEADLIIIG